MNNINSQSHFKVKMKKIPISYNKNINRFITYLFALSSNDYEVNYEDIKKKVGPENYCEESYYSTMFFCYLNKFNYDLDFTITIKDKDKKDFIFTKDWFNNSYKTNFNIDTSTINIKLVISCNSPINSRQKDIFLNNLMNLYNSFYPIENKFKVIN